jgi:hypothetical protein
MAKHMNYSWQRLREAVVDDPGRFAGGTAVIDPSGLLAVEQEKLSVLISKVER